MLTIAGITDERDTCENCGRTGLKRVVVLASDEDDFQFFGSTCASRAMARQGRTMKGSTIERIAVAKAQKRTTAKLGAWHAEARGHVVSFFNAVTGQRMARPVNARGRVLESLEGKLIAMLSEKH